MITSDRLNIIQREDVEIFSPAIEIDPIYAQTLKFDFSRGVEVIPLQVSVTPHRISIKKITST